MQGAMLSALMLVAPFAYASTFSIGNNDSNGGLNGDPGFALAQQYACSDVPGALNQVTLYLSGNNVDVNVVVKVEGDSGTTPDDNVLATSNSVNMSSIDNAVNAVNFNFSSPNTCSGTKQWIVLELLDASGGNDIKWYNSIGVSYTGMDAAVGVPGWISLSDRTEYMDFTFSSGGGGGGCGLGCAGIPTSYTAHFSTSTQQAAAISAVGDLSSFAFTFIPYIIVLIICLILIFAIYKYWKNVLGGNDWGSPINRQIHEQNKKDGLF